MLKSKFKAIYLPLIMLVLLAGCAQTAIISHDINYQRPAEMTEEDLLFSLLRNEYSNWKGTPYRLGGMSRKGIDCSALVQAVYKNSFKISLPRTTKWQVKLGSFVNRNALKVADLVFFKTGWGVRHVGIYLGDNQFLHASVSKGVKISFLDNVYWESKYWQSRRIID